MLLEEILAQIPGVEVTGDPKVRIVGISHDSRTIETGSLFVAIKGENTDGLQFLGEAINRGAVAFASESNYPTDLVATALKVTDARRFLADASRVFFKDPASELSLVAITGTNGKTRFATVAKGYVLAAAEHPLRSPHRYSGAAPTGGPPGGRCRNVIVANAPSHEPRAAKPTYTQFSV